MIHNVGVKPKKGNSVRITPPGVLNCIKEEEEEEEIMK